MKQKTINLYSFQELSEEPKEKAIESIYDINVDSDWWQFTFDDAERIGLKLTGFGLGRHRHADGEFVETAVECAQKIETEHGNTCETYKTAVQFLQERDALVRKYSNGVNTDQVSEENEYEFDRECDELESEFLRSILEDYSIILQHESEYLTSREAIEETINANEYTFTEDGKLEN